MNGNSDQTKSTDQQYQQQQLAQLRQETSSESSNTMEQSSERPWTDQGLNEKIVQKIRSSIDNGKLVASDVDNRVCEQLRSLPDDAASIESVFTEFNTSDLTGVVNKSAFLCSLIKQWKLRNPQPARSSTAGDYQTSEGGFGDVSGGTPGSGTHKPGPDEAKLKQVLDRTGYKLEITAGQRKYGGPPPDGPERPAYNSEIFIGKLPREIFEDELIPLCEEAGKIWDLRLMIDPASGFNKGYCFVTFCHSQDSSRACERLNGYAIRPGKILKVNGSVANVRLFIGNIPKTKSKDEIREELAKVVEGVMNIIVYTPADEADKKKNRGFCFVDFDTHKNASAAKRKLSSARVRIFNRDVAIDWADPDEEPNEETMATVKVLYVRNLTSDVTENDVKDLFLPYGNIERVRKVRDYAFVHFDKREDALNAMRALNGKILGRNSMEISLAKPLSDKRKQAQMKREQRKQFDPPFYARNSFGDNPPSTSSQPQPGFNADFNNNPPRGSYQGGNMNRGSGQSSNNNNFGGGGGFNQGGALMGGGDSRGGSSWRGNRGGGMGRGGGPSGERGGFSGNRGGGFNAGNRGGGNFNSNNRGGHSGGYNQNFRGGYGGPPQNNMGGGGYNSNAGFNNQGSQMGGGGGGGGGGGFNNAPNNQGGYGGGGGFNNGPPQNNQQFGRPSNQMGMGNNPQQQGFGGSGAGGMNPMQQNQQYGGYIVLHHPPYAIGPVLACYAAPPGTVNQMASSHLHPSISNVQKRIPLGPVFNGVEDKTRRQMIICNSTTNETVWSEQ